MKKLVALFLALVMVMSVSLAMADEDRVLNICTPNSDGLRSISAVRRRDRHQDQFRIPGDRRLHGPDQG